MIVTILKLIEDDGMCDNLIKWTIFVIFSWDARQKLLRRLIATPYPSTGDIYAEKKYRSSSFHDL